MFNRFKTFYSKVSLTENEIYTRYFALAGTYGAISKMFRLNDASVVKSQSYDAEKKEWIYEREPVLNVDKVIITSIAVITSCWIWPYYLYNDLVDIERYTRRLPSKVRDKRHVAEYLL